MEFCHGSFLIAVPLSTLSGTKKLLKDIKYMKDGVLINCNTGNLQVTQQERMDGCSSLVGSILMLWQAYCLCFSFLKNFGSCLTAGQKIISTCTDTMDQEWISILLHRADIGMLWSHQHIWETCGVWLRPCWTRVIYMTFDHI